MTELTPVRAWHANSIVADPSDVICPVYDTLSETDFARYATRKYNAAQFVPRPRNLGLTEFLRQASAALEKALLAGAYIQDERPSYYIYGIRYVPPPDIVDSLSAEERRPEYLLLGLVGALDFANLEHGQVALHERTFPDRVAERVALTNATGMTFAPILAGYHAADHHLSDRLERILGLRRSHLSFDGTVAPVVEATLDGTTHLLWRLDDPNEVAEVQQEVRQLRLLILDGHHRFTAAAQRFYDGQPSAPLVMIVDGGDRALQLLPWHRVLPSTVFPFEMVLARARQEFSEVIEVATAALPETIVIHLQRMRRDGVRGFLMTSGRSLFEVRGPPSKDAGADFDLLHAFLDDTLQIDPEALQFVRSPRLALESVGHPEAGASFGTAFLLPGLDSRAVEERAFDRGEVMAQKSTMFLPKVTEGMLFAPAGG
jgi:uncharacterized protein (DUF1015 family)